MQAAETFRFELFKKLAETANLIAWASDKTGTAIYFSQAWFKFIGFDCGPGWNWVGCVHADDRSAAVQRFMQASADYSEYHSIFRLIHEDREYVTVNVKGVPHFDDLGDFQGYLGVVTIPTFHLIDEPKLSISLLTSREKDVLVHLALGLTNEDVAKRLGVQPATVASHVASATKKLGALNRTHAVVKALRQGEISLPA